MSQLVCNENMQQCASLTLQDTIKRRRFFYNIFTSPEQTLPFLMNSSYLLSCWLISKGEATKNQEALKFSAMNDKQGILRTH